ncbi:hypothetical protein [Gemmatimonas sp.]|uniref:hypothetical protein n=1 Tax=Gemmatimonas sp. TaxID=1962908 RepID=UPI003568549C
MQADDVASLRANYWTPVAAALERYAPAAIDRLTALRLYTGNESIRPQLDVRHTASRSEWRLSVFPGYDIILRAADKAEGKAAALSIGREHQVGRTTVPFTDQCSK